MLVLLFADAGDEEADSVFTLQPEPIYYVSTKRSATIKCAAKTAAYIHIKCRDTYIEDSEISKSTTTINGIEILTVSVSLFACFLCKRL